MICPPRDPIIPGYGNFSLVHTSPSVASSLALSDRFGARITTLFEVICDWDLFMADEDGCRNSARSSGLWVFRMMTWQILARFPTVAARWTDGFLDKVELC